MDHYRQPETGTVFEVFLGTSKPYEEAAPSFSYFDLPCILRGTKDVTCDTGGFSFVGVGFSVSDFNGATISQYQAGTNFGTLVQKGDVTFAFWQRGSVTSDSGSIATPPSMNMAHVGAIPTTCDYILSIPAAAISDTISNAAFLGPVHEVVHYSDAHPAYCINQMSSYLFNSQTVVPANPGQVYQMICLIK